MLTVVRLAMLCFAVMIGISIGIGLHALMPKVSVWAALWYFFVLVLAFMFACTLVIASLMIGSAPGRSKLGQKLANKVDADTLAARRIYDQKRADARARQASGTGTTMPGKEPNGKRDA